MEMILTFENTNFSVKGEHLLLRGGLDVKVMPLPTTIRAGCGLCLRVPPRQLAEAETILADAGVPIEGVYSRKTENGSSTYLPVERGVPCEDD